MPGRAGLNRFEKAWGPRRDWSLRIAGDWRKDWAGARRRTADYHPPKDYTTGERPGRVRYRDAPSAAYTLDSPRTRPPAAIAREAHTGRQTRIGSCTEA